LTQLCVEDCDRALAVEDEAERCLRHLEPSLWSACQEVRDKLASAASEEDALTESWWRDFRDAVRAIAQYQALTPLGLRAKGEIFHEVWGFASETDSLGALQLSYMRDFSALAAARLDRKDLALLRQAAC
jgi:hypothetical protein